MISSPESGKHLAFDGLITRRGVISGKILNKGLCYQIVIPDTTVLSGVKHVSNMFVCFQR